MKKFLFLCLLSAGCLSFAQKKKGSKDIMMSTNIQEIENFLKTAHPEDPRRTVLKPKLIALKNAAWTSGKKNAKPMDARPIVLEVPKSVMRNPNSEEAEEFKKLIAETSQEHSEKTVKLLNNLFDQDITKKDAVLLVQNSSDCNLILRISGKNFYNLAVPAHGENSLVILKDTYSLTSNVCGIKYNSTKEVQKSMIIILNTPTVK